jgi:hypothetical protein
MQLSWDRRHGGSVVYAIRAGVLDPQDLPPELAYLADLAITKDRWINSEEDPVATEPIQEWSPSSATIRPRLPW